MNLTTHRTVLTWRGVQVETLEDLIPQNPKAIFVGINPSPVSVRVGHYHQGKLGKKFWKRLNDHGILNIQSRTFEDDQLLASEFGLTDIVKRPTKSGSLLEEQDFVEGRAQLQSKVRSSNPKYACFIYKRAAEEYFGISLTGQTGLMPHLAIASSKVFLMPGPYASKEDESRLMSELRILLQ